LGLKIQNGDYEIVHVGGSTNMSPGSLTNSKPIDESLMKGQGFSLIGVKGHRDKSSELWVRKNSGQRRLTITKKSFDTPWSVTVLDGSAITLKPDSFKVNGWCSGSTKDMDSQGNGWMSFGKYVPSGEGATIAAIFFDDPVEVTNANGGQILFKVFKSIGDGDGLATVLYQAGQRIPDRLLTRDHEGPDGAEEVCTVAVKVNLCGAGRSLDQGPDLDKDVTSCTGKESAYCPRLKKFCPEFVKQNQIKSPPICQVTCCGVQPAGGGNNFDKGKPADVPCKGLESAYCPRAKRWCPYYAQQNVKNAGDKSKPPTCQVTCCAAKYLSSTLDLSGDATSDATLKALSEVENSDVGLNQAGFLQPCGLSCTVIFTAMAIMQFFF
jgi:hypothetical protein